MEKLLSCRIDIESVPDSYILPPERRPGRQIIPVCKNIPVIDLDGDLGSSREEIVQKVQEACQEYGFFQLINHGIPNDLMHGMLMLAKDFFGRPAEDIASDYSEVPMKSHRLYTSIGYDGEKVHFWRDALRLSYHPLEDYVQSWPLKPPQYKEVAAKYAVELRKLAMWILDIIGEGLGFEAGYFDSILSQVDIMSLSHYPPCPDPSVTLGLPKHSDPNLLTILYQEQFGLQALIDEKWGAVEPLPNAFVVNVGCALQIISNGKLKSDVHRVVASSSVSRASIATGIHPCSDSHIEPAKTIVNGQCPARYRGVIYKDFVGTYMADTSDGESPFEHYELRF